MRKVSSKIYRNTYWEDSVTYKKDADTHFFFFENRPDSTSICFHRHSRRCSLQQLSLSSSSKLRCREHGVLTRKHRIKYKIFWKKTSSAVDENSSNSLHFDPKSRVVFRYTSIYSLVHWNWFSDTTECTQLRCNQWRRRQRTNFTASCLWFVVEWFGKARMSVKILEKQFDDFDHLSLFVCLFKVGISTDKMVYLKRSYAKGKRKKRKKRRKVNRW